MSPKTEGCARCGPIRDPAAGLPAPAPLPISPPGIPNLLKGIASFSDSVSAEMLLSESDCVSVAWPSVYHWLVDGLPFPGEGLLGEASVAEDVVGLVSHVVLIAELMGLCRAGGSIRTPPPCPPCS